MKQNLNILRFHTSREQKYNNRSFSNGKATEILCKSRTLLPFQIDIPRGSGLLTKFELTNLETGDTYNELPSISLQRSGITESYEETALTVLDPTSTKSAWGFGIGAPPSLRNIKLNIQATNANTLPNKFQARVYNDVDALILESDEIELVIPTSSQYGLFINFGESYSNSGGVDLRVEIKSNGTWSPIGNIANYTGVTTTSKEYVLDGFDYPDTPNGTNINSRTVSFEYLGNYDKIVYNGVSLQNYLPNGTYEAEIIASGETLYSDEFKVQSVYNDEILVEYWHDKPIFFEGGMFRFEDGYKNSIRFLSKVLKPEYKIDEVVKELPDQDLIMRVKTWKENKFNLIASEYMIDAIIAIQNHNHVRVTYNGQTYVVDSIRFTVEEWDSIAYSALCIASFTTNSVVTLGKGSPNQVYSETETREIDFSSYPTVYEPCIEYDYLAIKEITTEVGYISSYDHYVVLFDLGIRSLRKWNSVTEAFESVTLQNNDIVYINNGEYYYYNLTSLVNTISFSVDSNIGNDYEVSGVAFKTSTVQIIGNTVGENPVNEVVIAEIDGQSLIDGYSFTRSLITNLKISVVGLNCAFGQSAWIPPLP